MSTAEPKKRGPRRPKHEVLRDMELRVMRGKNEATLAAVKKLDRAYLAFGEVVNVAAAEPLAIEAIERSDLGPEILKLRAALVALLPEAIQPKEKPELPFDEEEKP